MSTFYSLIPAPRIPAVETALQQTFKTMNMEDIVPLTGGLSASTVYKIVVRGRAYVLKLEAPAKEGQTTRASQQSVQLAEQARQSAEQSAQPPQMPPTNLRLAADAGVAPPLYYQDIVTGVSISALIETQPIRSSFAHDNLTVTLAQTIRSIHRIACPNAPVDLLSIIDALIDGFKRSQMLSGPVFDECFGYFDKVRTAYPWQDTDKVFSHNDLNPNNVLCDGEKIWIIDWDTASVNDRYIDLANTANYFVHTRQHEQLFLETYFGASPDELQLSRFFIMRQVCRIIYGMLMFQLAARHKPAGFTHDPEMEGCDMSTFSVLRSKGELSLGSYEGQLFYGKVLINEAVVQMRSPRWTEAVDVLEQ